MAITATRFKFLDTDTNVAVADIASNVTDQIYNSANNALTTITDSVKPLVEGAGVEQITPEELAKAQARANTIIEVGRAAKNPQSVISEAENLTNSQIDTLAGKLFPGNDSAKAAFKLIGRSCKDKIISGLGLNKLGKMKFKGKFGNSSSKTSACSLDSLGNLLKSVAGQSAVSVVANSSVEGNVIASIAARSYEVGIPNTYSKLISNGMSTQASTIAGVSLLSTLSSSSDTFNALDVALSDNAKYMSAINPNASENILATFTVSDDYTESNLSSYYDYAESSLSNLDPNWCTYVTPSGESIISAANIDSSNEDLVSVLQAKVCSNSANLSTTAVTSSPVEYLFGSTVFESKDTASSLSEEFSNIMKISDSVTVYSI